VTRISKALKSNAVLKALTGLKIKQFKMLAVNFELHLRASFKEDRNVRLELGRNFVLRPSEDKLFFILLYMKCYPIFEVAGWMFDVHKSSCCRWVKWFLPALERTLGEKLVLPERKVSDPKEFLRLFPESYKQLSLMAPNDRYKGRKTARGKKRITRERRKGIPKRTSLSTMRRREY